MQCIQQLPRKMQYKSHCNYLQFWIFGGNFGRKEKSAKFKISVTWLEFAHTVLIFPTLSTWACQLTPLYTDLQFKYLLLNSFKHCFKYMSSYQKCLNITECKCFWASNWGTFCSTIQNKINAKFQIVTAGICCTNTNTYYYKLAISFKNGLGLNLEIRWLKLKLFFHTLGVKTVII